MISLVYVHHLLFATFFGPPEKAAQAVALLQAGVA